MVSKIFEYVASGLFVALLFCGTVLVHELGHFLAARWFQLRIDAFSIGMGPVLWRRRVQGVDYRLSLLPIGGYVALPQMDITGSAFENEDAKAGRLQPVAPWKRIVVAFAGPSMNVAAAFLLCLTVWFFGKPYDAGPEPAVVGWVNGESPAQEAGLREGDRVFRVNGDAIEFWSDFIIACSLNKEVRLEVVRDGEWVELPVLETKRNALGFLYLPGVGETERIDHVAVRRVLPGTPAERVGLEPGDVLRRVDGEEIIGGTFFWERVQAAEGAEVGLEVERSGRPIHLRVAPEKVEAEGETHWLIGIQMGEVAAMVHPDPLVQMRYFSGSIFRTLRGLLRSRERGEAAQGIGGPGMMIGMIHSQVRLHPMQALWFTALINVNLAILNLLPLVVLDGGHITLALFEMLTGRPLHRRVVTVLANTMAVVLIGLMVTLTVKDALFYHKLSQLRGAAKAPPVLQAAPTSEAP